ncbi:hypothetical protein FKP32DRAFT_840008 [Trametes sanguinea]|nr:hypothetical protein FKP32DRAFT_840008 [Trametes sanguinea]
MGRVVRNASNRPRQGTSETVRAIDPLISCSMNDPIAAAISSMGGAVLGLANSEVVVLALTSLSIDVGRIRFRGVAGARLHWSGPRPPCGEDGPDDVERPSPRRKRFATWVIARQRLQTTSNLYVEGHMAGPTSDLSSPQVIDETLIALPFILTLGPTPDQFISYRHHPGKNPSR